MVEKQTARSDGLEQGWEKMSGRRKKSEMRILQKALHANLKFLSCDNQDAPGTTRMPCPLAFFKT